MSFSDWIPKLQMFSAPLDLGMEAKSFGLLVAILLFLISLLANLLQHRYSQTRFNSMLAEEEAILNFLVGARKDLGNLEWNCTVEQNAASSPQEVGKAVHVTRNNIESTIADMRKHLHSFRQYRRKQMPLEKQKKRP